LYTVSYGKKAMDFTNIWNWTMIWYSWYIYSYIHYIYIAYTRILYNEEIFSRMWFQLKLSSSYDSTLLSLSRRLTLASFHLWNIYCFIDSFCDDEFGAAFGLTWGRIPFDWFGYGECNDPPLTTQYCPLLAPPNQTSQEVTHPGTTLVEARLTARF
jgi:hypothetical protein